MFRKRPLLAALIFQSVVILLAIGLAWLLGLRPWARMEVTFAALGIAALATAPLAVLLLLLPLAEWNWLNRITEFIEQVLVPLFERAPTGAVVLVSILAGIGEEWLFRGVIQDGLEGLLGPILALALASLLFGLVHAITPAYFILATLMGAYLGWLYLHTGNLLVPVIVHALYDWIAIRFYIWRASRTRTDPEMAG